MLIVDSHCHLNHLDFTDVAEAIKRADAAQVGIMQTICTHLKEFPEILALTEQYSQVFCSVGVHPLNVDKGIASSNELIELSQHPKVISLGETGLDYYYANDTKDIQRQCFTQHIIAAQITGLPLIIHARNADEDIVNILHQHMQQKPFQAVIHCFTSSQWLADACLELGCYISAAGIITFKNAEDLRNIFTKIPLDRLLVETDSPYLAPTPHRGKKNEPSFVRHTLEFLAQMRGLSTEAMATQTTNNFYRLFNKTKP